MTARASKKHALATIELFRPENGGKPYPVFPGLWLGDIRIGNDTSVYYHFAADIETELPFGELRKIILTFGRPDLFARNIQPRQEIFYCEGRAIGRGEILEFYLSDDELSAWED